MGIFDFFSSTPSTKKFGQIVIDFARRQGVDQSIRFDETDFRLLVGENGSHVLNLHNAYRDYCASPKNQRDTVLLKYTAGLKLEGIPNDFASAKAHLMPSVKPRGQGEYLRLTSLIQDKPMSYDEASLNFSDDAVLMLAYDTEHSMALVNRSNFETWGVSVQDAMDVALGNLRDRTADKFVDIGNGVVAGVWEDAYDSSRILLPDLAYRANCGSDPVIMVPTRGRFLLTAAANIAGQLSMIMHAQECAEKEGRVVSSGMYKIKNGQIVSYTPEHPDVLAKLKSLQTSFLAEDYSSQKELLETLYEKNKADVFVATFTVFKNNQTSLLTSLCTWTQGVVTLLPKTDLVALLMPGETESEHQTKIVTWDAATSIAADLMQEVEGYPVRYLVKNFPTVEQVNSVAETPL
ncbi:hypothetical protein H8L32_23350 [Undibacterium sp. CY18W]|uniref:DUF1444 family protein n=1 Tax=Undibacterium hunanense TaxID=2762292 RepID=A0ABR6ZX28_9BURK|nr:hypothetical protein [Undibacterium hunanense]MBC3920420.1 hypothetical protein [Undibacterium hunanense]